MKRFHSWTLALLIPLVAVFTARAAAAGADSPSQQATPGREQLSLDTGWRFHLGDIPFPVLIGHSQSYNNAKAGRAWGAAAPDFDDSGWRELNVPHDWAVEGPFDPKENPSQGYRPRGIGWYRRSFQLPPTDKGRHLELQFDGVATHCTVWVNGILAHRNWCGYTSFQIDLTPFARFGRETNTIAVRVDANAMEGWWYEGAGLYRHAWLVKRDPLHITTDGVFANPVRGSDADWTIPVEVTLENSGTAEEAGHVEVVVIAADGREVARRQAEARLAPLATSVVRVPLTVANPQLWFTDSPNLYQVKTTVRRDGAVADSVTTTCGFRTLRFDANEGFFLNDRPLKLQGTCDHQDHAGVGVALPDALWEFRVRRLKDMGSNAYRCAHNPPSKEFLDECDRQGLLVMDENRNFNTTPEYTRQLQWLVRRDRNHPSVILWSVFNEEPMQGTEAGYEMVRRMAAVVKQLDTTRPITAAMNGGLFTPLNVSAAVDVVGFNYQIQDYDRFHAAHPNLPLTSSEDTSAFMTRGEFVQDRATNRMNSYDDQAARWGATHRAAWKAIAERKWLAGGFVWTGFDYRGEPTPWGWPTVSTFFGAMDLCGFPKTAYYLHQAHWIKDRPILRLEPHWNWAGREGQPIKVMAITNAEKVALSLNGSSLGEKPVDPYEMVSWDVPYAPGRLEAVATTSGREVARFAVETTGEPAAVRIVADRTSLAGDGRDAQPVTVEIIDAAGRVVPTAGPALEFEITGPGAIIGHGNGDPNSHEPEKGNRRSAFHGLAQVIVQSTGTGGGPILLKAKAGGLRGGELSIPVRAVPAIPAVATMPAVPFMVSRWRMSPVTTIAPDPNQVVPESDQNSWTTVRPGQLQAFAGGNWAVWRGQFTPPQRVRDNGAVIRFAGITGRAEVWVDGKLAGTKSDFANGAFRAELPPGNGERTISLRLEAKPGEPAGLSGPVTLEPTRG